MFSAMVCSCSEYCSWMLMCRVYREGKDLSEPDVFLVAGAVTTRFEDVSAWNMESIWKE